MPLNALSSGSEIVTYPRELIFGVFDPQKECIVARRRIYRIVLEDESRLQELWSLRLTTIRTVGLSVATFIVLVAITTVLIAFTPLSSLLPGYMKKHQRADSIEALLKPDSLQNRYEHNQAYLNSIATIFDTDRTPTDSSATAKPETAVITDTIMPVSAEEQEFIKMMQEREKYNASILAPLAAEGLRFTTPSAGAMVENASIDKASAKVLIPRGNSIRSVTDGTVVDIHYDILSSSYSIIIQHSKGFLSKYIGTGQPVVAIGREVVSGENIAMGAYVNGKTADCIVIELWRNGLQLIPSEYITPKDLPSSDDTSQE